MTVAGQSEKMLRTPTLRASTSSICSTLRPASVTVFHRAGARRRRLSLGVAWARSRAIRARPENESGAWLGGSMQMDARRSVRGVEFHPLQRYPRAMEPIFFDSPAEWRAWLEANHDTAAEVWVGMWKAKTGKPTVTWADAVRQALRHITQHEARYYLILAGDHVYKMDYSKMLRFHRERGAALTLAYMWRFWAGIFLGRRRRLHGPYGVRDLRPVDFDHSRAGFDESASEQTALADGPRTVPGPRRRLLVIQVERLFRFG